MTAGPGYLPPAPGAVAFAFTAYGEGAGIVPAMASLWNEMTDLALTDAPIVLSDSSPATDTVVAAQGWAAEAGARLVVDRSDRRRSAKEALNVAFQRLDELGADVAIMVNPDVVVAPGSVASLLTALGAFPGAMVATGLTAPDPAYRGVRRAAAAWQMHLIGRAARMAPPDAPRAEGSLWAARRSLFRDFRFELNSGSNHDDIELARALRARGWSSVSVVTAIAYKVPAASPRDFTRTTRRTRQAMGRQDVGAPMYRAAMLEAVRRPGGAAMYALYRLYGATIGRGLGVSANPELWDPVASTKRPS